MSIERVPRFALSGTNCTAWLGYNNKDFLINNITLAQFLLLSK